MLSFRDFAEVFSGKKSVESLAGHHITVKDAMLIYAKAYFPTAFGLAFEAILISIVIGVLLGKGAINSVLGSLFLGLVLLVLVPISYIVLILSGFVWASIHFFIAGLFKEKQGHFLDFASSSIAVFACSRFVVGMLALIPVLGWFFLPFAHLFSVGVYQRFVKARLGLSSDQSWIVVLVLLDIMLAILFSVSLVVLLGIAGQKFLL